MSNQVNYTYLFFDVRDYSNNSVLSTYSLDITPVTFVPDYTSSDLLSGARSISNKVLRWDFGDGTFSTELTARHHYQWPGQYKVRLTVYDRFGNAFQSSYTPVINVRDFVAQDFVFDDYGKFVYDVPASRIIDPLKVLIRDSWQNKHSLSGKDYTVSLYASGAAGDYQNIYNFFNDKWSHMRLLSRFYIKQRIGASEVFTPTDRLSANMTEIYTRINNNNIEICSKDDLNSTYAGTTGFGEFWYVDDRTKNYTSRENPIFIFATLDNALFKDRLTQYQNLYEYITPPPYGFQTLRPAVQPIIKVRHNSAAKISLTTTGIDGEGTLSSTKFEIPQISWENTKVPFIAKFKDPENYTTKTYPPLSSSSTANTSVTGITAYDIKFGIISYENGTHKQVENVKFYEDFDPQIPQSIGGFYKGYFISDESATNCALTASVLVIDPVNFPKDSIIGYISVPQYNSVLRFFREQKFSGCTGTISMTLTAEKEFKDTKGNRNILSIQVAPSGAGKGRDYEAWLADSVNDSIIRFDLLGNVTNIFKLSACPTLVNNAIVDIDYRSQQPGLTAASPSSIVIDGKGDAWCALFDSGKIIKIDSNKNYVNYVATPLHPNNYYILSSFGSFSPLSGFAGEGIMLPSSIDTDISNNLWAAYTHPVSNFLVQYNSVGSVLTAINLPPCVSPVELCIDRGRNIWLTALNLNTSGTNLTARNDFLYKFNSNGELLPGYPLNGFRQISYITLDGKQNAWVAHDKATITRVDAVTNQKTDYIAGSGTTNITNYVGGIGGMTSDTSDYLWVINNPDKKLYVFDTNIMSLTGLDPISEIELSFPVPSPQYPVSAFEIEQFQAYGDWFGFRWINKYMVPFSVIRTLTGESNRFNIFPSTGAFNITKINEDYNLAKFYNDTRYQEVLLDKEILFNEFIGTIVGDLSAQPYELGKTVYERIANFISNRVDIDKCNLDALLSFCAEFLVLFENYNYPFPPQLRRIIDILSIKRSVLWGEQNKFNSNFNGKGTIPPNYIYGINLGDELNTLTDVITSGQPIVAYEKFSEIYTIVNDKNIAGYSLSSVLPLSTFNYDWGWGLVAPKSVSGTQISNYYKLYSFNPQYNNKFYDNIINWNDPHTTLSYNQSSYQEWTRDSGIMQTLISYELSKGLRLFTSGANIVYNN